MKNSPFCRLLLLAILAVSNLSARAELLPGLISRWAGDGTAIDSAGTNHGIMQNGAAFGAGVAGQAFSLDGLDDFVRIPFSPTFDFTASNSFTVMTWVSPRVVGAFGAMVVKCPANSEWDWGLYWNANSTFAAGRHLQIAVQSTTGYPTGEWHHVAFTYNAGAWALYVDGTLHSTASGIFVTQSTGPLAFGRKGGSSGNDDWFGGLVDDVQIFNRALSNSEIKGVFDAVASTTLAPVISAQPQSRSARVGAAATLKAEATGPTPIGYHWFHDGSPITGGVGPTLTLGQVNTNHAGSYFVVVSNQYASVTSHVARLWIVPEDFPGSIAFSFKQTLANSYDLWLMSPDGSNLTNLTQTPDVDELEPKFSPTAGRIAFVTASSTNAAANGIWVMDVDGSQRRQLAWSSDYAGGVVYSPTWLNDDTLLFSAFGVNCKSSVFKVAVAGGPVELAFSVSNAFRAFGRKEGAVTDITPDGTRLLMCVQQGCWAPSFNLYTVDTNGSDARVVYVDSPDNYRDPVAKWSPQGNRVAFSHWLTPGANQNPEHIGVAVMDGSSQTQVLTAPTEFCHVQDWSPDGGTILFLAADSYGDPGNNTDNLGNLWTMNPSGGSRTQITFLTGRFPMQSPGGGPRTHSSWSRVPPVFLNTNLPPCITGQPLSQSVQVGGAVTFTLFIAGTSPLSFQWRKDGVVLPDATNVSLSLPNSQAAHQGGYSVAVSNSFGVVTSLVANLKVLPSPTAGLLPQNIPLNSTVEIDENLDGVPDGWHFSGSLPLAVAWSTNQFITSQHGLLISDSDTNNFMEWFSDVVPVQPGVDYLLRLWRRYHVTQGVFRTSVAFRSASGNIIGGPTFLVSGEHLEWEEFNARVTVPTNAVSVWFTLTSGGGLDATGDMWMDNLSFAQEPSRVPEITAAIAMTNVWYFNQTEYLDFLPWQFPGFDDSAWPSGPALLFAETNVLVTPRNTPLTLGRTVYYFRSSFVHTGDATHVVLTLSFLVDDGAVFYLNGREIARVRMPGGVPIYYTNYATTFPPGGDAVSVETLVLSGDIVTNLVNGTNVLAVEVHQASATSSDVVFGCALSAERLEMPSTLQWGHDGVGRFLQIEAETGRSYNVQVSTNFSSWISIGTIHPAETSTRFYLFPNPLAQARFYRVARTMP